MLLTQASSEMIKYFEHNDIIETLVLIFWQKEQTRNMEQCAEK
ncbi:hypothetical protein HanIR_Chr03g0113071 [Helianthus annuus]|nr:hypothetical protein HanIR_Chr03g0113071 [Helianthus annuus]